MKIDKITAVLVVLGVIALTLAAIATMQFVEHYQMLVFERELDNAVRMTKAYYGGN